MKVRFVPRPFMSTTILDGKDFPLAEAKAAKQITVETHLHTKTRVYVSLRHRERTINVNFAPPGTPDTVKFHSEEHMSYYSGRRSVCQYFVQSKKQGLEAFRQHIERVVTHVFSLTAEEAETFELCVVDSDAIRALTPAPQTV